MFTYDLTDEDYERPYNAPGRSRSYFELDDEVGTGRANRRADALKIETILGNSGDLDLDDVGGPTGMGNEAIDKGLRSYQKRNGLKVDGWVRPGGPTITKMKEQFGGLLGDYEAPTPQQSDTHHRMRDAGFQGFLNAKRQDLLLPPIPGLPKPNETMLGANHSLVRTVREGGLRDVPGWMAKRVRAGKDGVVEARDFVDQLEKLIPGEGTKAIRGILHALADTPQHQQAFFGGPVIDIAPVSVFEHDGPQRYEQAIKTRPWEAKEQGKRPPAQPQTREWNDERDGPPPQAQNRPITVENAGKHQVQLRDTGADSEAQVYDDGLLDPARWNTPARDEDLTGKATATDTEDEDANAIQTAQAQGQQSRPSPARPSVTRTEGAWVVNNPGSLRDAAQENGGWLGVRANGQPSRECVGLVQHAVPNIGHTSTWRAGDKVAPVDPFRPFLQPGTPVATFEPNANGELRYPNRDTGNHAGIFTRYGQHNGREGIWMMDQYNDRGRGEALERFYPFERRPGERGYRAGDFSVIRPQDANRR